MWFCLTTSSNPTLQIEALHPLSVLSYSFLKEHLSPWNTWWNLFIYIHYSLSGSWRALQFLHLPINKRNMGPGSCSPGWDLPLELAPNNFIPLWVSGPCPRLKLPRQLMGRTAKAHPCWPKEVTQVTQGRVVWKRHGLQGDDSNSLRLPNVSYSPCPHGQVPNLVHHLPSFWRK